jgi:hypothetical protein
MGLTREEYKQWQNTYWVDAAQAVANVVQRFKETQSALENRDAARFVSLTADDSADGLFQTATVAENLVSTTVRKLEEVMFTEKYRAKHRLELVAIRDLDNLDLVMSLVTEDLVRGVRLEHEAVAEDAARLATVADGTLPNRLSETLSRITDSLSSAKQAVDTFSDFDEDDDAAEEEVTISTPTVVEMSKDRVDLAVVDKWNEQTLKNMGEGSSTPFYQINDLVIIDAQAAPGAQPYLEWAKLQAEIVPDAAITMVKKGGAFGAGSIKAVGVMDRGSFETAIKRVSKKKVDY